MFGWAKKREIKKQKETPTQHITQTGKGKKEKEKNKALREKAKCEGEKERDYNNYITYTSQPHIHFFSLTKSLFLFY